MKLLTGEADPTKAAMLQNEGRTRINVAPSAVERLRALLFQPEMRAVGYSEFIHRACAAAEAELERDRRTIANAQLEAKREREFARDHGG